VPSEEWPPTTTSAAGDRSALDAAWSYEQSPDLPLADLVAFEFDNLDGWLEEDDPIRGHPRDPYHRFDY
jgi:hypothetical protein